MYPIFTVLFLVSIASAANSTYFEDFPSHERLPQTSSCGRYGIDSSCASPCEPKCSTRAFQTQIYCIQECVEGCKCKPGYIKEDKSGLCVKPKYCKNPALYKKSTTKPTKTSCAGFCT